MEQQVALIRSDEVNIKEYLNIIMKYISSGSFENALYDIDLFNQKTIEYIHSLTLLFY